MFSALSKPEIIIWATFILLSASTFTLVTSKILSCSRVKITIAAKKVTNLDLTCMHFNRNDPKIWKLFWRWMSVPVQSAQRLIVGFFFFSFFYFFSKVVINGAWSNIFCLHFAWILIPSFPASSSSLDWQHTKNPFLSLNYTLISMQYHPWYIFFWYTTDIFRTKMIYHGYF